MVKEVYGSVLGRVDSYFCLFGAAVSRHESWREGYDHTTSSGVSHGPEGPLPSD